MKIYKRNYKEFTSAPNLNEWVTVDEMWSKFGVNPYCGSLRKKLQQAVSTMKRNYTISPEEVGRFSNSAFIKRSAFLRDDVNDTFTYYAKYFTEHYPEMSLNYNEAEPEEEPAGEIVSVNEPEPETEKYDLGCFAIEALNNFLHDWEPQVNMIVKRISFLTRGDGSGIQDILHYLHECVERDAGVKLARLAGDDTKISVIRKDVRLQYYFLREARFLALKNGIVYNEYI